MDEYMLVVWAAYAVAFLVLGGCTWVSLRGLRGAQRVLSALERQ